ncbi:MAG: DUF2628 domain-containing protein [Proteobacteria bacterium]|nr:DUF2628 domain-containing protein [Pseudomonadota bacterium]
MKLYNALIKKNQEGKIAEVVLLKEGFSIWAFLFSAFWFLYHKMRKEFLVLLLVNFVFVFTKKLNFLSGFDNFFLEMAFFFIIALNANYWLVDAMKKRGYEFVGLVFGSDAANAKMRFVENLKSENLLDLVDLKIKS